MKGKNGGVEKKTPAFQLRVLSVFSWQKDKMLLGNFLIMFCTFFIMMALEEPACAKPLSEFFQGGKWGGMGHVIFLLPILIWLFLLTPLPILWGIHSIKERKLKKIQQSKQANESQDESMRT
ncbi:hypothetical protein [Bartonella sp. ML71XJBT]|uniref:hypothetical protein n=1 Tax=Bartonella sp. ML71XJBT TaxID=3019094 RepID=UPI00235DD81D|nr:hypothetical protein [Bartonella sp. ML71XJBT]